MQTIAIVNEKGGTGKTTTSVSLSAAMGELGKRVLLIDLDGQGASSRWLGVEEDNRLADALVHGTGLEPVPDVIPGVSLAPATGKLDSVAHDLRPTQGGQLRKVLRQLGNRFDYAFIDCPPSLGNRLIGNALLAATHAVVPVETSILALDGLRILLTTLEDVREGFGHNIALAGVLACRFDSRTRLSRLVLAELKRALPEKVFQTVIRENVRMRECPASGKSILEFAPDSHAAEDYRALAKEVLSVVPATPVSSAPAGGVEFSAPEREALADLRNRAAASLREAAGGMPWQNREATADPKPEQADAETPAPQPPAAEPENLKVHVAKLAESKQRLEAEQDAEESGAGPADDAPEQDSGGDAPGQDSGEQAAATATPPSGAEKPAGEQKPAETEQRKPSPMPWSAPVPAAVLRQAEATENALVPTSPEADDLGPAEFRLDRSDPAPAIPPTRTESGGHFNLGQPVAPPASPSASPPAAGPKPPDTQPVTPPGGPSALDKPPVRPPADRTPTVLTPTDPAASGKDDEGAPAQVTIPAVTVESVSASKAPATDKSADGPKPDSSPPPTGEATDEATGEAERPDEEPPTPDEAADPNEKYPALRAYLRKLEAEGKLKGSDARKPGSGPKQQNGREKKGLFRKMFAGK